MKNKSDFTRLRDTLEAKKGTKNIIIIDQILLTTDK